MSGECDACGEHTLECTCGATVILNSAMERSINEVLNVLISKYEAHIERLEVRCDNFLCRMDMYELRIKEEAEHLHKKIISYKGSYSKQISEAETLLNSIKNHMKEINGKEK